MKLGKTLVSIDTKVDMKKEVGTCRECHTVALVDQSEGYWHDGLCDNCIEKEMNKHG